jgi:hypothetical protein
MSAVGCILMLRYLLIGLSAGLVSVLGLAMGEACFISLDLFNLQSLTEIWYSLEPVFFILSVFLIFKILFTYHFNSWKFQLLKFKNLSKLFYVAVTLTLLNPPSSSNIHGFMNNLSSLNFHTNFEAKVLYIFSFFIVVSFLFDSLLVSFIGLVLNLNTLLQRAKMFTLFRRVTQLIALSCLGITLNSMIACGSGLLFFLRCLGSRFCALP